MLKIENTKVYGWEAAIRGMRNPMNSWATSDSDFENDTLGENDFQLAKKLAKAGSDHGKYLRMITVTCDVTAPLYFYKEADTYKVGTVCNSCSTMHKIQAKEFTLDDFSYEHLMTDSTLAGAELVDTAGVGTDILVTPLSLLKITVCCLNNYRKMYLETKDKNWWWQMIQLLPSAYNQRRTYQFNYQVLANIYKSRKNHKLDEWHTFCDWIKTLPYSELITGEYDD